MLGCMDVKLCLYAGRAKNKYTQIGSEALVPKLLYSHFCVSWQHVDFKFDSFLYYRHNFFSVKHCLPILMFGHYVPTIQNMVATAAVNQSMMPV